MRILFAALALVAAPAVLAQIPVAPAAAPAPFKVGQTVRDASGGVVGTVERLESDGSVRVINETRFIIIPAATLSTSGRAIKTSLTRKELRDL